GDIDYFISLDSSRLSRNTAHQLIIIDQIKKVNVQLVFVKNTYEDSPEGRFQITIMAAVDEYERARMQLRSELGKRAKAAQGKLTHSPGLYGYDFDKETDILSINEKEAEIVRMMYRMLLDEDMGPHSIAKRLNDKGIPGPRSKMWYKNTVKRILVNTAYKGVLYIRRYDTRETKFNKYKDPEEKVKRVERPREEWVPVEVPAIIDEETWNEAQEIMKQARRKWRSYGKACYLLSAMITCGLCGSTIHGNLITQHSGRKYRYYVCTARSPGITGREKCELGFIRAEEIEDAVWDHILRWINNPEELQKELENSRPEDIKARERELEEIRADIGRLAAEKDRVATMFQKEFITEDEMEKRMRDIVTRSRILEDKMAALETEIGKSRLAENDREVLEEISGRLKKTIGELTFNDKYEIIRAMVREVVVYRDKIIIKARIPSDIAVSI
ncbi:MAG: recombinase family protein, partial [Bacillota bacterium]|nr:recombinase family protein [Bacillota bacterium]